MGTKLKVNFYGIRFKIFSFVLLLVGIFAITTSVLNFKDIFLFIDKDSLYIDGVITSRTSLNNSVNEDFSDVLNHLYFNKDYHLTKEQKESYQGKLDKYLNQGDRFFFVVGDKVVFDDGKSPKLTSDEILYKYNSDVIDISSVGAKYKSQSGTVYIQISEKHFNQVREENEPYIIHGRWMFYNALTGIVMSLMGLIFLVLLAGKNKRNSEVQIKFYNKIYNDVLLAIYLLCSLGILFSACCLCGEIVDGGLFNIEAITAITYSVSVIFAVLTAWIITSFSKRIKMREFFKYTLIYKTLMKAFRLLKRIVYIITKPFVDMTNKTIRKKLIISAILLATAMFFNSVIIASWAEGLGDLSIFWIMISVPVIAFATLMFILRQTGEFEALKKGAGQIRNGNLSYKIPVCKNAEINQLADDINNIGDGLNAAVQNAILSEKMKAELITNVSHDLKTPLTSIIEYIDLISQEDGLSNEAEDYIGVLKNKSERLKNIISDLFDLSKSASGNSELTIEKLDLKKLVVQTLADMDDKVVNSGHIIKQNLPENEVFINADGKKLYRVFQNVIDNALKYTLRGTRIFVDLKVTDSKAIVEIQNIASYEMNFTEQEILERFTRGDKSRTTDGTGLGLSIAETFTKNCGGLFNIKIDGDQFMVIIEFNILAD